MPVFLSRNGDDSRWDKDSHYLIMNFNVQSDFYIGGGFSVIVHELGHAFAYSHSTFNHGYHTLASDPSTDKDDLYQTMALDESFSDMTVQALEFYLFGKNDWKIGADITIHTDAIRYMDDPTRDCGDHYSYREDDPDFKNICSIDHMKDIEKIYIVDEGGNRRTEEHFLAGVFNKAFYLLSTTPGWDTKKAYIVMAEASQRYWARATNFTQAACGVIQVIQTRNNNVAEIPYDVESARQAFSKVGIDTTTCGIMMTQS